MARAKATGGRARSRGGPLADFATERLREEILHHKLHPGDRLATESIAERLGVSATPVREALARLAGEGLVTAIPQRGFRVSVISEADVQDLYEMRILLEPLAIERSVACMTTELAESIEETLTLMNEVGGIDLAALSPDDYFSYEELHIEFHKRTMSRCDSAWLHQFTNTLLDNSRRIRQITIAVRTDYDSIAAEHRAIATACIEGNAELAAKQHVQHLERTLDAFRQWSAEESS